MSRWRGFVKVAGALAVGGYLAASAVGGAVGSLRAVHHTPAVATSALSSLAALQLPQMGPICGSTMTKGHGMDMVILAQRSLTRHHSV